MRSKTLFVLLLLATTGCRLLDRDKDRGTPRDRESSDQANPVSRTKTKPRQNWLEGPTPGLDKADTPPAGTWADPRDPGFDLDRETRGMLSGYVEDAEGRKIRDAYIEVEAVRSPGEGRPMGVTTTSDGHFLIRGLKPRESYQLTTIVRADGRVSSGRAYATAGSERGRNVRIPLLDGVDLTPAGANGIRPPSLPNLGNTPRTEGLGSPRPAEAVPELTPTRPTIPPRSDMMTEEPNSIRPPVTSIPNTPPTVIPPPPSEPSNQKQSRGNRNDEGFRLVDGRGGVAARKGEPVLLDFMTTWCGPCKKSIPTLNSLSSKYASQGVRVVAVLCDDADESERRKMAEDYRRRFGVQYEILVEPEGEVGNLMNRYGVKSYPTLVLVGGDGRTLWTGHPSDSSQLERALRRALDDR